MTKLRRRPATRFHAFLVEPAPGFNPNNWRQKPRHYRIVEYIGPNCFRGTADAWKFLYNHEAIQKGDTSRWALLLDFEKSSELGLGSMSQDLHAKIQSSSPEAKTRFSSC